MLETMFGSWRQDICGSPYVHVDGTRLTRSCSRLVSSRPGLFLNATCAQTYLAGLGPADVSYVGRTVPAGNLKREETPHLSDDAVAEERKYTAYRAANILRSSFGAPLTVTFDALPPRLAMESYKAS